MKLKLMALCTLSAIIMFSFTSLFAQTATLTGKVTDSNSGEALIGANIMLTSNVNQVTGTSSTSDGSYTISNIKPGEYSISISYVGYAKRGFTNVHFASGESKTLDAGLLQGSFQTDQIVVTASKKKEKVLDAPANVQVRVAEQLMKQAVITPVDHIKSLPGVDIVKVGLVQSNVVTRGFNNVFSGALLTLVDNRISRVPSIRFNSHNFISTVNNDIERMEVVLGPGAALYGPNSANGVLHMITKSPFGSEGTNISLTGGERGVMMGEFRHAMSNEKVGFKLSGQYYQGDDWETNDEVEDQAKIDAIAANNPKAGLIGARNFEISKYSLDGRLDFRATEDLTIIFNGGFNNSSNLDLTGLGAGQAIDWTYYFGQTRVMYKDFFFQAFLNKSNSGDTYLLRDGSPIDDQSSLLVAQAQHNFDVGERSNITYGFDMLRTTPQTNGTINGRHEDDDEIKEWGAYAQSETKLTDMLNVVLAARYDDHQHLEDPFVSPRAALVFKPAPEHTFRATYNRAFDTPSTNNLFLDLLSAANFGGTPYDIRVYGSKDGFTFRNDANGGVGGLYMQSPFSGTTDFIPADATQIWSQLVAVNPAFGALGSGPGQIPNPGKDVIGTVLRVLNPTSQQFEVVPTAFVQDIKPLVSTTKNTFEVGYKGIIKNKVLFSLDVYQSRIKDFIGPLRIETPNVFYDPASLAAYLSNPAFGLPAATIGALTAGIASVPLGTITATNQMDNNDLFLTYRNFGDIDLNGLDFTFSAYINRYVSWDGYFSWTDKDIFKNVDGVTDIALNAPSKKFGTTVNYSNSDKGIDAFVRMRYTAAFPVNSGVYVGPVEESTLFDVNFGYEIPNDAMDMKLSLTIQNVTDNMHIEMVGAPEIGRLALLRLGFGF